MFANVPPTPVTVPPLAEAMLAPPIVNWLATLSATKVFVPAPPSMEPDKVPPFRVKVSF